MAWLNSLLIVVQVLCAVAIIVLILLQHGKGADMGAAFGGGASGSLFGASGSANFLSRTTAVLASVFFLTTIAMAYTASSRSSAARGDHGGVMSNAAKTATSPASAPVPTGTTEIPPTAPPQSGGAPSPSGAPATTSTGSRPSDIPK